MSQINVRDLCNENEDGAPTIVGVSTFSATSYMCPPKGTTAQRPSNPVSGSLRFNTDTASLEYYKGNTIGWTQIEMTSPDLDGGARGVYGPGESPAGDTMEYITISTLGNATDFGNLIAVKTPNDSGCSNSTRGLVFGSRSPANTNVIEYITIATAGNAIDFGDSTFSGSYSFATSNSTRALSFGGSNNVIEYVEILTTGNAVDFGDCHPNQDYTSACSNAHGGL